MPILTASHALSVCYSYCGGVWLGSSLCDRTIGFGFSLLQRFVLRSHDFSGFRAISTMIQERTFSFEIAASSYTAEKIYTRLCLLIHFIPDSRFSFVSFGFSVLVPVGGAASLPSYRSYYCIRYRRVPLFTIITKSYGFWWGYESNSRTFLYAALCGMGRRRRRREII